MPRRSQPKNGRTPAQRPKPDKSTAQLVDEAPGAVAKAAEVLGGDELPEVAVPAEVDEASLKTARQRYDQAARVYDNALAGLADREDRATRREQDLDAKDSELAARAGGLRTLDDRLTELRSRLDQRDRALLDREIELSGRLEREKEEVLADARQALAATLERVEAERRALDEERERGRAQLREELDRQRQELAEERTQLQQEKRRQRAVKTELDAQAEDLADTKAMYAERLERAVAAATEHWQLQCRHFEDMHRVAREQLDHLEQQLAEQERVNRAFGHRTPREVLDELEAVVKENAELRQQQRFVPDDATERLAALQEEQRHLVEERAVLLAENGRLQRQLSAHQSTAVEVERLKVTKEAAQATVRAYQATVEELKRDMEGLIERRNGASPFPACSEMDDRYGGSPDVLDDVPPLPELVARVRALICQQHRIYYSEQDLRCFLAGLATSQLHLLQGMSGIGKTELPQRFAEALGASSAVISVGADWRTPQDLMGYYNAFERKFYESEFTQALYQAQCPQFARQPFFVVLDEMNLSYPEQYFNDVLSAMELRHNRDRSPRDLVLMSAGVEPAPRLLREGRRLPLPGNVWFIGTANHDETTVSFADKTYDRAHVLELPARHESFETAPVDPLGPISVAALKRSFVAARRAHGDQADKVRAFLDQDLAPRVLRDFRISWGSRVRKQVHSFVSVVVAGGGSVGEAADHIVATKILRKLRGRHEVRVPKLESLRDDLVAMWSGLDPSGVPVQAVQLLDEEMYLRGDL
jgi:hypothetical protein